jgi:ABC-type sugar transport system permease subunit
MSAPSPTLAGFRAAFRRPSLTFAEIAWRWVVGSTTLALFFFYCIEYLDSLPVSNIDAALLSTRHPVLVGKAIGHILRGSLNRAVLAALFAGLALCLMWIIGTSFGRLATVRALLSYFGNDPDSIRPVSSEKNPRPMRALIDLSFLRAASFLAVVLALAGGAILASFVSTKLHPRPGLSFVLFIPLALMILSVGSTLNWWLSLAGIFAVRDGQDALGSISSAVDLFRQRTAAVFAVGTWTGLAHLVAFSIASTAASFPLAFARIAPSRLVLAGVVLITLAYLAVADWLYIARLAGYVYIAETPISAPEKSPNSLFYPPQQRQDSRFPLDSAVDRDEPILSDVPNLALET